MIYDGIREAIFLQRVNRFTARVEVGGKEALCHVRNTGRCRELFVPGAAAYVQEAASAARKTRFSLIAVRKGARLVNVDSQAPNAAFGEWAAGGGFLPGIVKMRPEYRFLRSRFDFRIDHRAGSALVEVKGVTLEREGVALFPDAPTERGVKHLRELTESRNSGFDAYMVFVVQMQGVRRFEPNAATHPAFRDALVAAVADGVRVFAMDCMVEPDSMRLRAPVEVAL
jgi:sugar fermentation stimulation protein A